MSVMEKSREWTVFSQSAALVISSTQATVGHASIIGPTLPHALCFAPLTLCGRRGTRWVVSDEGPESSTAILLKSIYIFILKMYFILRQPPSALKESEGGPALNLPVTPANGG
ncbi:hypothetical protein EYF80_057179 [Liparis tanakae]|uniref:Uncharacterized protein n=1 Tax=Liparis tanakae TaxID=230148 RepID=A0A4Z2EUQ6_9TELE|nr:hypothetical protein EYF80_057179 [Liparis tanakae]